MKHLKRFFEAVEENLKEEGSTIEECIAACNECIEKCEECAESCEKEGHDECAQRCRECVEVCKLCVWSMENDSPNMDEICELCAEVCESCADCCEEDGMIEESSNSGINPVLRKHQKDIIKDLDNRFNILHVSRQIGATFTIAFDLLHYLMFNSSKSVVVFCPKKSNCSEFYDIVFTHYKSLPFYLKKGIKSYKSGEKIVFDDNSRVFFKSSINGGIGFQIDYLILSDFAYIKDGNNLQSQLFPMLFALNDSRILVYSVGHKDTMNHFNLMVDRYNNQTMSLWNLSTYPYYCMDFSDSFPSNKISSIGEESFMIEYECLLPGSKQFLRHQKLKQLNI